MLQIKDEDLKMTEEDAIIIRTNADINKVLETVSRSVNEKLSAIYYEGDVEKLIEVYKKIQEQETKLMISVVKGMYEIRRKREDEKKIEI